jgi:tRNA threonylcarbamoyl adenosine modification protein (Sua5/YciO/YrdC/YwlC family)
VEVDIVYFVHGTTTDNEENRATGHAPGELSDLGVRQAKDLGEKVEQDFDVVYCSDLHRARKSAKLAFGEKYDIIEDERLRECDYGEKTQEKFDWNIENFIETSYPGGESYREVEKRISVFLNYLWENHQDEKVAVVAHQAPQLALEVLIGGKTWEEAIKNDWREVGEWQPGWNYTLRTGKNTGPGTAIEKISEGGIGVFPTETAYGIAADALNEEAVERVYEAKKRPRSKPLTVICSSLEQVEKHAELTENERKLVEEFMPGPLTLVVEKKEHVPDNLNDKFVFRISSSETARNLAEKNPITATSANISGQETSYSIDDVSDELLETVDFVVDRGELEDGPTSTIAEVKNSEIVIHRRGPVAEEDLLDVLKNGDGR